MIKISLGGGHAFAGEVFLTVVAIHEFIIYIMNLLNKQKSPFKPHFPTHQDLSSFPVMDQVLSSPEWRQLPEVVRQAIEQLSDIANRQQDLLTETRKEIKLAKIQSESNSRFSDIQRQLD